MIKYIASIFICLIISCQNSNSNGFSENLLIDDIVICITVGCNDGGSNIRDLIYVLGSKDSLIEQYIKKKSIPGFIGKKVLLKNTSLNLFFNNCKVVSERLNTKKMESLYNDEIEAVCIFNFYSNKQYHINEYINLLDKMSIDNFFIELQKTINNIQDKKDKMRLEEIVDNFIEYNPCF